MISIATTWIQRLAKSWTSIPKYVGKCLIWSTHCRQHAHTHTRFLFSSSLTWASFIFVSFLTTLHANCCCVTLCMANSTSPDAPCPSTCSTDSTLRTQYTIHKLNKYVKLSAWKESAKVFIEFSSSGSATQSVSVCSKSKSSSWRGGVVNEHRAKILPFRNHMFL